MEENRTQPRSEQLVQPLRSVFVRPMDDHKPTVIYVVTASGNNDGRSTITPYFSSEGLSWETTKLVRQELGLPALSGQAALDAELEDVIAGRR